MIPPLLRQVRKIGHSVFLKGEYNLNIVGIRATTQNANRFDDLITVTYRDAFKQWITKAWPATTDPGSYWLKNPGRLAGTAILVPGQYRGAMRIGEHRGKYRALVQRKPVRVWRDNNRDEILDWGESAGIEGMYGINIHRSSKAGESVEVGKWSAGCQVFKGGHHFDELMKLVVHASTTWGSNFTYTLCTEGDLGLI